MDWIGKFMSILMLFIVSLMWSFVGILVKTAATMVSSGVITFCRFFFGVFFLAIFIYLKDRKINLYWREKWIWIGVLGKCANYIFENIAIATGYAYGIILGMPLQAFFILLLTSFYFKEKIPLKNIIAVFFCLAGVFIVVWNGKPLGVLFSTNAFTTLLFTLSAMGISFHLLSQKVLINKMDSGNMNLSVFLLCSFLTAIPLPFTYKPIAIGSFAAVFSLLALGFITGISFYIYANSLKNVPFLAAVLIPNSSVLFSLLWSRLFFNEPVTLYVTIGAILFLIGVIVINLPRDLSLLKFREKNGFLKDIREES